MSIVSDKPPTVNLKRVTISVTFCNGGRYGKRDCFGAAAAGKGTLRLRRGRQRELGITRAAIWKSISALRAQGYEIDAVTGRGYCLKSLPDTLTEQTVRSYLGPVETVGKRIDCFDSIDSTNAYLKRIALDGAPDGTVAVAAEQTSGRGRRGRSFQSAAGKGVYLSILLRPKLAPSQLMPLTGLIAVAMSRAVDRVAGTHSQIKWTNDLILNGRKLCGILTELSVEGETGELQYVVAGIGFNVSQREEDFVGEVSKIATSILRETGRLISRAELSAAMIEELDALYTALRSGETSGYLDEYRRRCVTIGREVQLLWQDTKEKVTALDVDEEFGLIVRRENGTVETVRTGEVSVRGLYGYVE